MSTSKKNQTLSYVIAIGVTLLIGGLSAFLTRNDMEKYAALKHPPLAPPGIVFPIVWTVLFILMGVGAAMIYNHSESAERRKALLIYSGQLIINFIWTLLFFGTGQRLFAFVWLILLLVLVIWMYFIFNRISHTAAYLQIPYILWLCFAAYLNFGSWFLNR